MSNGIAVSFVSGVGRWVWEPVRLIGDCTLFGLQAVFSFLARPPRARYVWPILHLVSVQTLPVVLVAGMFIGMVIAIQTYDQFSMMHMENQLGAVINVSLVKELGPIFASLMIAGRVGTAMAAEIATMRVTEQIDALTVLGADPIRVLVVPRIMACVLLLPFLALCADAVGMASGWFVSVHMLGVDSFFYWLYSKRMTTGWEIFSGLIKTPFFGGMIATVVCHRGFNARAGAEGVGRAATEAFVWSFIAILAVDFLLGTLLMKLYYVFW